MTRQAEPPRKSGTLVGSSHTTVGVTGESATIVCVGIGGCDIADAFEQAMVVELAAYTRS